MRLCYTICLLFSSLLIRAQYFIRGDVRDEKSQPLQNVRIVQHSSKQQYYSGTSGDFGINAKANTDSLTFTLDGYEPKTVKVNAETIALEFDEITTNAKGKK